MDEIFELGNAREALVRARQQLEAEAQALDRAIEILSSGPGSGPGPAKQAFLRVRRASGRPGRPPRAVLGVLGDRAHKPKGTDNPNTRAGLIRYHERRRRERARLQVEARKLAKAVTQQIPTPMPTQ